MTTVTQNKQFFDAETQQCAFPHVREGYPSAQVIELGLSARQYAAIKLHVPNSGSEWLDAMIQASLRDKFASQVIAGGVINSCSNIKPDLESWVQYFTRISYEIADAMLAERSK